MKIIAWFCVFALLNLVLAVLGLSSVFTTVSIYGLLAVAQSKNERIKIQIH